MKYTIANCFHKSRYLKGEDKSYFCISVCTTQRMQRKLNESDILQMFFLGIQLAYRVFVNFILGHTLV